MSKPPVRSEQPVFRAALAYFALVFSVGFALGTLRVYLIAPQWGGLPAVLLEAPVMLFVSWLWCGVTLRLFGVREPLAALGMGALAFVLLMTAEAVIDFFAIGRSTPAHLQAFSTPAGVVGLASQLAFAIFPFVRSLAGDARTTTRPDKRAPPPQPKAGLGGPVRRPQRPWSRRRS